MGRRISVSGALIAVGYLYRGLGQPVDTAPGTMLQFLYP